MTLPHVPAPDDLELDALLASLADAELDALAVLPPPPTLREALLAHAPPRLERYADRLAGLVDLPRDHARDLLIRAFEPAAWEPGPGPGMTTLWVEGGPATRGCIRGFLRIEAGLGFPHHRHLGHEQVLVLDGVMLDSSGAEHGPGALVEMATGTEHAYQALAGGPDLLIFVVAREGVEVGPIVLRHRDF